MNTWTSQPQEIFSSHWSFAAIFSICRRLWWIQMALTCMWSILWLWFVLWSVCQNGRTAATRVSEPAFLFWKSPPIRHFRVVASCFWLFCITVWWQRCIPMEWWNNRRRDHAEMTSRSMRLKLHTFQARLHKSRTPGYVSQSVANAEKKLQIPLRITCLQ